MILLAAGHQPSLFELRLAAVALAEAAGHC